MPGARGRGWGTGTQRLIRTEFQFVVVRLLSPVQLFVNPWTEGQASLSSTISWSLLKLMSIESVMPSNHLILCCPFLLSPLIFLSMRVFSSELALCIRWPKYQSFSFNTSPSNEYSGLISFRIDWFDLLAIQGTLTSLLNHHNSKTSILQCSALFMVQLSHLYMTTVKTIALTMVPENPMNSMKRQIFPYYLVIPVVVSAVIFSLSSLTLVIYIFSHFSSLATWRFINFINHLEANIQLLFFCFLFYLFPFLFLLVSILNLLWVLHAPF